MPRKSAKSRIAKAKPRGTNNRKSFAKKEEPISSNINPAVGVERDQAVASTTISTLEVAAVNHEDSDSEFDATGIEGGDNDEEDRNIIVEGDIHAVNDEYVAQPLRQDTYVDLAELQQRLSQEKEDTIVLWNELISWKGEKATRTYDGKSRTTQGRIAKTREENMKENHSLLDYYTRRGKPKVNMKLNWLDWGIFCTYISGAFMIVVFVRVLTFDLIKKVNFILNQLIN